MFKRKKWQYLILDEAHMIKNWKSLRWQTLLNFNSKRRLLITGVLMLESLIPKSPGAQGADFEALQRQPLRDMY